MEIIKILQFSLVLCYLSSKIVAESPDMTEYELCILLESERSFDRSGGYLLWPDQRIPYTLDDNVQENETEVILRAINDFHNRTCLRFQPKTVSDPDNIHIKIDRGNKRTCGSAHLCLQKIGPQTIYITDSCVWVPTFVHELGHAACLPHEHVRWDRDEYLEFSECQDPSKVTPIQDRWTTRFQRYDYFSTMHYGCGGCFGVPSKTLVQKCGIQINKAGLSVIDADKINELYDCQGCHRHRWYRVDTLTAEQEATLVNFAAHLEDHEPVYLCRGFIGGYINTGIYIPSEKACLISYSETSEAVIAKDIQLFGLPLGPNVITTETSGYHLVYPEDKPDSGMVPMGRDAGNGNAFAAVREIEDSNGQRRILLGVMTLYHEPVAQFFYENETIFLSNTGPDNVEFYTIACF